MDIKAIGMGLVFALMWSSAFTSARIIVAEAPPISTLSIRFLISGIIAIITAKIVGQTWSLTRLQWRSTLIFGVCQNALYLGLYFYAMQTVQASFAAIIASTMPLLVAVVGWAIYKDRIGRLGVAGLVAGLVGVGIIMGSRLSGQADLVGVGLCVLGVFALTFATLSVRNAASGGNVLMIVGLQMLIGSAVLSVYAISFETWDVDYNPKLIAAFSYTVLIPGLAATWIWFKLVNRIGALRAATFHFLNPFLGVAIAAVILDEPFGAADLLGIVIITAGIWAVQVSKQTIR